jgi:hypothetical protein
MRPTAYGNTGATSIIMFMPVRVLMSMVAPKSARVVQFITRKRTSQAAERRRPTAAVARRRQDPAPVAYSPQGQKPRRKLGKWSHA